MQNRIPTNIEDELRSPTSLILPPPLQRPSQLLTFGAPAPEQYCLFNEWAPPLRFVFKRHRATTLHTDFRLEVCGVLLSWAFWKHPSLDPRKIILAREMPDHQIAYMESERRIPEGAYGAGPMIVWDYGVYRPLVRTGYSDEHTVVKALQDGCLDFWLEGIRVKGGFRLQMGYKGWEFSKLPDAYASLERVEWDDRSAITGRTPDDVEADFWNKPGRPDGS